MPSVIKKSISFVAEPERRKTAEDKSSHLRCVVTWGKNRVRFNLGYRINPDEWAKDSQRCKVKSKHGKQKIPASIINKDIEDFDSMIRDVFVSFEEEDIVPTTQQLREKFEKLSGKNDKSKEEDAAEIDNSIFPLYDKFMKDNQSNGRWNGSTDKKYTTLKNHLLAVSPKLTFDDLNENGLNLLIEHFSNETGKYKRKGLSNETISKNLELLRVFLRWANEYGYCELNRMVTQRPRLKRVPRPVVFLEWDELMTVYNYDFKNQHYLANVRDIFCFCCFTSLRYSDVKNLKWSDFNGDNSFTVTTIKTADRVTIELNKYALSILDKYREVELPGKFVFPVISNQKFNAYLKKIGEKCKLDAPVTIVTFKGNKRYEDVYKKRELMSSHMARRTFVTNALSLGIPPNVVMKWTGHSDYKAMIPYIEIADSSKKKAMTVFDNVGQNVGQN